MSAVETNSFPISPSPSLFSRSLRVFYRTDPVRSCKIQLKCRFDQRRLGNRVHALEIEPFPKPRNLCGRFSPSAHRISAHRKLFHLARPRLPPLRFLPGDSGLNTDLPVLLEIRVDTKELQCKISNRKYLSKDRFKVFTKQCIRFCHLTTEFITNAKGL